MTGIKTRIYEEREREREMGERMREKEGKLEREQNSL